MPVMAVPCLCNCGDNCTIGTDDFSGSLSGWSTTGTPTTSGGLLVMNSDGDRVIFNTTPSSASDGVHILTYPLSAGSGVIRIIANWLNSSNYIYGEYSRTDQTIRIGKVVGGTDTYETPAKTLSSPSERATLRLCWQPGESQAPASSDTGTIFPTTVFEGSGGVIPWESSSSVLAEDGISASAVFDNDGETTNSLTVYGMSLAIPAGATIDGVKIRIECFDLDETASEIVVESIRLVDGEGTAAGDDKGADTPVPFGSLDGLIFGGAADDWNAGLTWEDVNSPLFGAVFYFRWDDGSTTPSRELEVDYVNFIVYYTTASRQAGQATFSYIPNGGTDQQCTIDGLVVATDGTATGIAVVSGDWDFTEWTLSYLDSGTHPGCPTCDCVGDTTPCGACDSNGVPVVIQIDIDNVASLGDCDCETEFNGTYLLDFVWAGDFNSCGHQFTFASSKCVNFDQSGGGLTPRQATEIDIVFYGFSGNYFAVISIIDGPQHQSIARWTLDLGATAPDCTALSGEAATFVAQWDGLDCDFSGATVTVTAV